MARESSRVKVVPSGAGQLDADQLAARQRGDGGARQLGDPQLVAAVAHQLDSVSRLCRLDSWARRRWSSSVT